MNRIALVIGVVLLLTGCPAVNPYQVPRNEAAFLQNRDENIGPSYFLYEFINAKSSAGIRTFEPEATTWRDEAVYTIPAGEVAVGVLIYYYPDRGPVASAGEALSTSFAFLFSAKARDRVNAATTKYLIWGPSPSWPVAGPESLLLQAAKGETYHVNCRIDGGRAYLWIEDSSGRQVSNEVPGYGIGKHNTLFLWDDLPEIGR